MIHIKIKQKIVFKTNNIKEALHTIGKIFKDGHDDVSLHGGKIGRWR